MHKTMTELLQRLEAGDAIETIERLEKFESELEAVRFGPSELAAVKALLVFLRTEKCNEVYIGGVEGSKSMLQIDAQVDEADQIDVISSFLLIPAAEDGPVRTVAVARRGAALNLTALFWRGNADAPLLLECDGTYGHVLCGLEGVPDSWAPLTLNHWRTLERTSDVDARIAFAKPRPRERAALG